VITPVEFVAVDSRGEEDTRSPGGAVDNRYWDLERVTVKRLATGEAERPLLSRIDRPSTDGN